LTERLHSLDCIDAYSGGEMTLAEWPELLESRQVYFGRLCKRSLSMLPDQYRWQQRGERAKTLLKHTNKPIGAIALAGL